MNNDSTTHDRTVDPVQEDAIPDIESLRDCIQDLERRFTAYDGGDRPMSPPVQLMRDLFVARHELAEAERFSQSSAPTTA